MLDLVLDHPLFRELSGGRAASADAQSFVYDLIAEWPSERPFDALAVLAEHPELWRRPSAVVELAAEEFRTRTLAGERIDHAEFAAKFASVAELVLDDVRTICDVEGDPRVLRDLQNAFWPEPGHTVAGYRVLEELGRGSFARVYLAEVPALGGRKAVVKFCPRGRREARTLGALEHRHIVPVHSTEWESECRLNILCMPYLSRATLLDVLERVAPERRPAARAGAILEAVRAVNGDYPFQTEPPQPERWWSRRTFVDGIVELGAQVADALAFVHAAGVCHGDIKPSNVLVTGDGRALLMDFNLAKPRASDWFRGGTLAYMAPEWLAVLAGEDVDVPEDASGPQATSAAGGANEAADVFSLGATLYHLLTGSLPFGLHDETLKTDEAARDLLERHRRGAAPVRSLNASVDPGLAGIIHQCLELDPRQRPQSASALVEALRSHFRPGQRCRRWLRRHRLAAGAAALAAVCGVVAVAVGATGGQRGASGEASTGRDGSLAAVVAPGTRETGGRSGATAGPADPVPAQLNVEAVELEKGCRAVREERYEDAIGHLNRVLELNPDHLDARFVRGQARLLLGEQWRREADAARYHGEKDAALRAARRGQEFVAAAREDFDIVGAARDHAMIIACSAYCRALDMDPIVRASAIPLFEQAISPECAPEVAWNNIGFIQLESQQFGAARTSLERALRFNEHLAAAHRNVAMTWLRQALALRSPKGRLVEGRAEHFSAANRHIHQALAIEPSCAESWLCAAEIQAHVCEDYFAAELASGRFGELVAELAHAMQVASELGCSANDIERLAAVLKSVGAESQVREILERSPPSEPPLRATRLVPPFSRHALPMRLSAGGSAG